MIKLSTIKKSNVKASIDIVDAAVEAIDAYQAVVALGVEMRELDIVMCNIEFARDSIKANGAQWYINNCDPKNTFKDVFGIKEISDAKYISAAEEGIREALHNMWEKIREFFARIAKWFKDLFSKPSDTTKINEDTKVKIEEVRELEDRDDGDGEPSEKGDIKKGVIKRSLAAVMRFLHIKGASTEDVGFKVDDQYHALTVVGAQNCLKHLVDDYRHLIVFSKKAADILSTVVGINPESSGSIDKMNELLSNTEALVREKDDYEKASMERASSEFSKWCVSSNEPIPLGKLGITKVEDINHFYNFANEFNKWTNGSEFKANCKVMSDASNKVENSFKTSFPEGVLKHEDTDANRCLRVKFDLLVKLGNIARECASMNKDIHQMNETFAMIANDIANAALKELKK